MKKKAFKKGPSKALGEEKFEVVFDKAFKENKGID